MNVLPWAQRHEVKLMWVVTVFAWAGFLSWAASRWTTHPLSSILGIAGVTLDLFAGLEAMRLAIRITPLRHLRILRHKTRDARLIARIPVYAAIVAAVVLFVVAIEASTPTTYPFGAVCFYIAGALLLACCVFLTAVIAVARARPVQKSLTLTESAIGAAWLVMLAISVALTVNGFIEVA